ncbi:unnamed protein product, partial [Scytosiphon promiscuus]
AGAAPARGARATGRTGSPRGGRGAAAATAGERDGSAPPAGAWSRRATTRPCAAAAEAGGGWRRGACRGVTGSGPSRPNPGEGMSLAFLATSATAALPTPRPLEGPRYPPTVWPGAREPSGSQTTAASNRRARRSRKRPAAAAPERRSRPRPVPA